MRDDLVASDPALALVGSPEAMPRLAAVPLAVYHSLDATDFHLEPDGALTMSQRSSGAPKVQFTPEEVLALATFFRMPGVMPLIERAEAARQTAAELGFQESQREEAELIAAGKIDP